MSSLSNKYLHLLYNSHSLILFVFKNIYDWHTALNLQINLDRAVKETLMIYWPMNLVINLTFILLWSPAEGDFLIVLKRSSSHKTSQLWNKNLRYFYNFLIICSLSSKRDNLKCSEKLQKLFWLSYSKKKFC